jgi:hypothetical protein
MWKSPVKRIDPITQLVVAAISSSLLRHHLFARESELLSEALSWMILPAIHYYWGSSRVRSGSRATVSGPLEHTPASGVSLWAAALAVSSASLYQAEYGIIAFLVNHFLIPELTKTPKLTFSWYYSQHSVRCWLQCKHTSNQAGFRRD